MKYIFAVIAVLTVTPMSFAEPQHSQPLEEGYLVAGIEGRVAKCPDNAQWEFFPAVPIVEGKGLLPAQKAIPLLCCSTLEQMAQLAGDEKTVDVRVWAMVTEFRGQNYLYSLYFQPLKAQQAEQPPVPQPKPDRPREKESVLPDEIMQMMQRNRTPDLKRLDEITAVSSDRNLIHRTGLMRFSDEEMSFSPDAFGRNAPQDTYRLLPSKALESVQRSIQRTPGRQRYVVSGVMTQCQGQTYLLIRRAVRTYTHGNFTP